LGQKVNPIGLRVGIIRDWESNWYAEKKKYREFLQEDLKIRQYLRKRLEKAGVSRVKIERKMKDLKVAVDVARPAIAIGRKGVEIEKIRNELKMLTNRKKLDIDVREIKHPEADAQLIADGIAKQLEQRASHKRAMKKSITTCMRSGMAKGVKIMCSGRLGGAEMARTEEYKDGRIPLHTLRADIDYAIATAHTIYGCIGVKVWIYRGEIIGGKLH